MRYRTLGKTGLVSSEIGFGAWAIGGSMWGGADDAVSTAALERALEQGVTLFDTALVYGMGRSERLVGQLWRAHQGRAGDKEILVATKVPPLDMRWPAAADASCSKVFPAAHVERSCERSLANLGVERIDLLQLHVWADAFTDDDELWGALDRLRAQGKVRAVGVSINDHQPATALRVVASGRIDAVQVIYNVFDQSPEDELLPACARAGVGVLARVPFDEGSLTGKLRPDTRFPEGDFRASYFRGKRLGETVRRVEALRPTLAGRAGGSLAQGALRFCLSHPAVSTVIPGMRTIAQVDDDTAASDAGSLAADTLAALRPHRWVRDFYS
jgi:aryl-alcohol dehydrogenase-like predicted oxidoreductase